MHNLLAEIAKEKRTEPPIVRSLGGGSLRGPGRVEEGLGHQESQTEPYQPPPSREEHWSSQESGLGPHVLGPHTNASRGGAFGTGEPEREVIGGDDRRWMHRRVELLSFDG